MAASSARPDNRRLVGRFGNPAKLFTHSLDERRSRALTGDGFV